ncbi:MAG: hypothetical protein CVV27_05775 [Candidatus Melainabacteria bacterium HGW-Melainabacteria-1]|nr:MAG: hypothetical protein CVV27_05775 [Candidatus Melainabacteria bacterium HGW-Melainabacteria-1]
MMCNSLDEEGFYLGIHKDVTSSAIRNNVRLERLAGDTCEAILRSVLKKFTECPESGCPGWLWENLVESEGVVEPRAWEWIKEIHFAQEIVMFFNDWDEEDMFLFPDPQSVTTVLGDCYDFEYYLTNMSTDFLITFNHHDGVSACGTAMAWLRDKIDQNPEYKKQIVW